VTVQLPIYNEKYVVRRAIDAVAALDWPRDRLQIQVLDDSTDETRAIARAQVERIRQQGIEISHTHRTQRGGFKAGALNEAMPSARGDYVAVFDADFVPPPSFLKETVPHLVADPGLGFVQARWGHLNDRFSPLTLAQAVALDGHFAVEHTARDRAGLLTNFSGTGGVWRKRCIEECGGWDARMLTEDVDLSYRAQLAGWRGRTLPDVMAPAELPVQLAAFKRQQYRWAKGNTQCLLKQGGAVLRAPLSWFARIQALVHLSYYLAHPLMLVVMWVTLPLIWYGLLDRWALAFLSLATLGPPLLYAVGQRSLYSDWWRRLKALPVLICLGTGLALNSTVAAVEAVLGIESAFERTPKFQIEGKSGNWRRGPYALSTGRLIWGEILLTIYAILTVYAALARGNAQAVPFLLLYVAGFGYVSIVGAVQWVVRTRSLSGKPSGRPLTVPGERPGDRPQQLLG
jgi:cellulose synthase/poly-beta-1,6-N-acetylglucosamine synthase-like glycosyltransferase